MVFSIHKTAKYLAVLSQNEKPIICTQMQIKGNYIQAIIIFDINLPLEIYNEYRKNIIEYITCNAPYDINCLRKVNVLKTRGYRFFAKIKTLRKPKLDTNGVQMYRVTEDGKIKKCYITYKIPILAISNYKIID